jgi:hypothetical protein
LNALPVIGFIYSSLHRILRFPTHQFGVRQRYFGILRLLCQLSANHEVKRLAGRGLLTAALPKRTQFFAGHISGEDYNRASSLTVNQNKT